MIKGFLPGLRTRVAGGGAPVWLFVLSSAIGLLLRARRLRGGGAVDRSVFGAPWRATRSLVGDLCRNPAPREHAVEGRTALHRPPLVSRVVVTRVTTTLRIPARAEVSSEGVKKSRKRVATVRSIRTL